MESLLENFKNFFKKNKIPIESRFLIGVSGGLDSMATLSLMLDSKLDVQVAHINYQLRKEENSKELRIIKKYCENSSVVFHAKKVNIDSSKNTQVEARNLRYEYFNQLVAEHKLDYIITAHHQNDDHETFLLNAIRGSGINGLKGIPELRSNILRPVLQFSKSQLITYAKSKNIPFNTDSSNLSSVYNRNFLRNKIFKSISTKFPSYEKGMTISINNLKKDYILLNGLIEKMILPSVEKKGESYFIYPSKNIPTHCWSHFFRKFGFNFEQISLWLNKELQSGKYIESSSFRLIKDRDSWILSPIIKIESNKEVQLELDKQITFPLNLICSTDISKFPISKNINLGLFNFSKILFPLKLRIWKPGDTMQPLGARGKKKVSDILINKKISIIEKEKTYVLISNDEIIWLIGYCISEKYKVIKENEKMLKVIFKQ
jgi:tRNA(Ile)-lysidine synthase